MINYIDLIHQPLNACRICGESVEDTRRLYCKRCSQIRKDTYDTVRHKLKELNKESRQIVLAALQDKKIRKEICNIISEVHEYGKEKK